MLENDVDSAFDRGFRSRFREPQINEKSTSRLRGFFMNNHFAWALASVISIAGLGAASAADMPLKAPPPVAAAVYNWTGFYIGVNGGGIWGQNNVSSAFFDGSAIASAQTLGALAGAGGMNGSSAFGGVQAGYNWQGATPWVFGVEADIQGMDLNENRTSGVFTVGANTAQDFDQIHHGWLATFRGRAGYTVNRALFYVTGGLAVGDTRFSRTQTWSFFGDLCPIDPRNGLGACHVGSATRTSAGATVGAGVEYAFFGNWTAKLEYLHVWLQDNNSFLTQNVGTAFAGPPILVQRFNQSMNDSNMDLVRVGINYRFGAAPVVAKY
jgi:outer membrane immunogenic protein